VPRPQEESPVVKLSVNLIQTYKRINEVYYEAKRKRQLAQKQQQDADAAAAAASEATPTTTTTAATNSSKPPTQKVLYNDGHDDEHSDYIIKANEMMHGRYVIKQRIGRGSFGQVVMAFDAVTNTDVAVKIIKSKKPFHRQAKTEIELLERLNKSDPEDSWFIVRLLDTFCHQQHQCLVSQSLILIGYVLFCFILFVIVCFDN
jgi:dual specificity tyrosine-phosphorylation-regulated kinase 1